MKYYLIKKKKEKGINSPVLNIFENLIEMINISIYFDNLESNEENTM